MPHIVIFLHDFFTAFYYLKHCCYIIGTHISATATKHCKLPRYGYCKKAYILKYLLEFHNQYWMQPSISPFYDVYNCV